MMNKKTLSLIFLLILVVVLLVKTCGSATTSGETSTILPVPDTVQLIRIDTIYPPPQVVTIDAPVPPPQIVYTTAKGEVIKDTVYLRESSRINKVYTDTFYKEDIDLYYTATVSDDCELISNQIDYQLKVPREIIKTETTTITQLVPTASSQLLLTCRVGTNWHGRYSVAPGMKWIDRKGWSVGYSYDPINQEHAVVLGARLFQLK